MGFISLIFMMIYMIVMLIGVMAILISLIIFFVRFIRKKNGRKTGVFSKVAAIISLVLGILCEIPFIVLSVDDGVEHFDRAKKYSELEDKYQVGTEHLEDEFVYHGETLVCLEEFEKNMWLNASGADIEANLIFKNSDRDFVYYEFYKLDSESDYDMYMVAEIATIYVRKEDKEKIIDFYQNKAHYTVGITCNHDNEIDDTFDISKERINAMVSTNEKITYDSENVRDIYEFNLISKYEICEYYYYFILLENGNFLCSESAMDDETEAWPLSQEDAEYIESFI